MKSLFSALLSLLLCLPGCRETTESSLRQSFSATEGFQFGSQREFFFGLATAPGHVEDQLVDAWIRFAREGKVAAFKNATAPEERLRFWSDPEPELKLAAETGVSVLRMGVDWGRLAPHRPGSDACGGPCPAGVQDRQALQRYKEIVKMARAKGMRIIMTLFHHSAPLWFTDSEGWVSSENAAFFVEFARDVVSELQGEVDIWLTANEPATYLLFTYSAHIWPPGGAQNPWALINMGPIRGDFWTAMTNMTDAHKRLYALIHEVDKTVADPGAPGVAPARVGIAHLAMQSTASDPFNIPLVLAFDAATKFTFVDKVAGSLDFLGLNYYGEEVVKGFSVEIGDRREYSDSGRAINPLAFYKLIGEFHERYNLRRESRPAASTPLPILITENGVSDGTDLLRPAYIVEHLAAIAAARKAGVPIEGFVNWTISDNMEWADGYCPKFGLVAVDREHNLARTKRPSFDFWSRIVAAGGVSEAQRAEAWGLVSRNVGKPRHFCRAADGKTSLDSPEQRPISKVDWRFRL